MRVHVVLCVQDTDKMKLTACIDTDTNVQMFVCRLQTSFFLLKIFFLVIMGRQH